MEDNINHEKCAMNLSDFKRLLNDYECKNLLNFDGYNCLTAPNKPKLNRFKDMVFRSNSRTSG